MTQKVPSLFISYRRATAGGYAGRLHDLLLDHYHEDDVFFDRTSHAIGTNFTEELPQKIRGACVYLVLICQGWAEYVTRDRGPDDQREDYLLAEVTEAGAAETASRALVIPIFLPDAERPTPAQIKAFRDKNTPVASAVARLQEYTPVHLFSHAREEWNRAVAAITSRIDALAFEAKPAPSRRRVIQELFGLPTQQSRVKIILPAFFDSIGQQFDRDTSGTLPDTEGSTTDVAWEQGQAAKSVDTSNGANIVRRDLVAALELCRLFTRNSLGMPEILFDDRGLDEIKQNDGWLYPEGVAFIAIGIYSNSVTALVHQRYGKKLGVQLGMKGQHRSIHVLHGGDEKRKKPLFEETHEPRLDSSRPVLSRGHSIILKVRNCDGTYTTVIGGLSVRGTTKAVNFLKCNCAEFFDDVVRTGLTGHTGPTDQFMAVLIHEASEGSLATLDKGHIFRLGD